MPKKIPKRGLHYCSLENKLSHVLAKSWFCYNRCRKDYIEHSIMYYQYSYFICGPINHLNTNCWIVNIIYFNVSKNKKNSKFGGNLMAVGSVEKMLHLKRHLTTRSSNFGYVYFRVDRFPKKRVLWLIQIFK